jgi:hypothetical protein
MPVLPNASPDELNSPFFIANKEICQSFDQFIVANKGETHGNYNAFSYNVLGKVKHPNKWEFNIKKSSFTSGNLLLSSKYQCLHVASIWTAKNLKSDCPKFKIRPKKLLDFVKIGMFKNWNRLSTYNQYVIKSELPNHKLIINLFKLLGELLDFEKVWEIQYQNSELRIELRSESTHTSIIEKLLKENYS